MSHLSLPSGPTGAPRKLSCCTVSPKAELATLSRSEIERLVQGTDGPLLALFRKCALAVLNTGANMDDAAEIFRQYADFRIEVLRRGGGIRLRIHNAPAAAFVDGEMVEGIRALLFAVLRDVLYMTSEIAHGRFDPDVSEDITSAVFHVLRQAGVLETSEPPRLAVCWGGHAISREEYDFTKEVGYELGLRRMHICTGCGPGAMKGPMKGAAIAHAKQRMPAGRYVGLTEPGIIAAEPPNPIVNQLVILPDIEKRLEAFVRLGSGFVVFPGGVGTLEEILYLLGLRLHPDNTDAGAPIVFAASGQSASYFEAIDRMIRDTLGEAARAHYQIVIDDPPEVARRLMQGMAAGARQRQLRGEPLFFDWQLHTPLEFQQPFEVDHAAVAALALHREQPAWQLAASLRRAFSAFVAGNVKQSGIEMIRAHGPFLVRGDPAVLEPVDTLLDRLVREQRMRLTGDYIPCYRIVSD